MEPVGKAFGFYIKYWQQMEALYGNESKEGLLNTLPEEMRRMIEQVRKRANEQAAVLLKEFGAEIENHFEKLGNARAKIRSRSGTIEADWEIDVRLWPKRSRRSSSVRWEAGLLCEYHNQTPILLLFVWARGGREAEGKLARMLGKRVAYRSSDFGWYAGTVCVGEEIPLKVDNDFQIDRDSLVERVRERLVKIGKRDVERLFEI
jgi:hypothetical protein